MLRKSPLVLSCLLQSALYYLLLVRKITKIRSPYFPFDSFLSGDVADIHSLPRVLHLMILSFQNGSRRTRIAGRSTRMTMTMFLVLHVGRWTLGSSFLVTTRLSFVPSQQLLCSPTQAVRQGAWNLERQPLYLTSSSSTSVEADGFVQSEDLGALQRLFSKYCDEEGLMSKTSVMEIPAISELMVSDVR